MQIDYAARQRRLAALTGVDAVALVPGANLIYTTGLHFHLSERPTIALFDSTGLSLIIPELEVPQIAARPDLGARLFTWADADGYAGAFAEATAALKLENAVLGVDGQTMRVFEWLAFEEAGVRQMREVGQGLLNLRAIKSADEVQAMREAVQLSEGALHRLLDDLTPGMTERRIAARLSQLLDEGGSEGEAFGTLVQTGPNSALPHGGITERALERDEFLLIDFGGRKHGYPADITRTFCLGEPSAQMREIYETVLAANRAAIAAVKPGAAAGDIDRAARRVIEDAGYGAYFIHRTGHGLGLEVHELPQIAAGNEQALQEGMVFTVEPGIYVPGLGGVRIEDVVHVTATGAELLTQFPYDGLR